MSWLIQSIALLGGCKLLQWMTVIVNCWFMVLRFFHSKPVTWSWIFPSLYDHMVISQLHLPLCAK